MWGKDVTVVIAGLTNTYSSYVTTFEEYAMQRYEGASTIFGPHTLDAYIQVCCHSLQALCCTHMVHVSSSVEFSCFPLEVNTIRRSFERRPAHLGCIHPGLGHGLQALCLLSCAASTGRPCSVLMSLHERVYTRKVS